MHCLSHKNRNVIYGMLFPINKFNMLLDNVNKISEITQLTKGNKLFQPMRGPSLHSNTMLPSKQEGSLIESHSTALDFRYHSK